jgi:hypothetical protein
LAVVGAHQSATPVWKGKLVPDDTWGYALKFDNDCLFFLGYDDRPALALPPVKGAERQPLPLFAASP